MSLAVAALASLGLSLTGLAPACSSDAVGIDACRSIQTARCEEITACGVSSADSEYCVAFYQDQCLHGLAKPSTEPGETAVTACVEALRAVGACARTGAQTMAQCANIAVVSSANPTTSPCNILQSSPELLSACAFLPSSVDAGSPVVPQPDASADADPDASIDATIN